MSKNTEFPFANARRITSEEISQAKTAIKKQFGEEYTIRETKKSLQIPQSMIQEINLIAEELNITNEAVIKMMLRRSLDEHYLAKTRL